MNWFEDLFCNQPNISFRHDYVDVSFVQFQRNNYYSLPSRTDVDIGWSGWIGVGDNGYANATFMYGHITSDYPKMLHTYPVKDGYPYQLSLTRIHKEGYSIDARFDGLARPRMSIIRVDDGEVTEIQHCVLDNKRHFRTFVSRNLSNNLFDTLSTKFTDDIHSLELMAALQNYDHENVVAIFRKAGYELV